MTQLTPHFSLEEFVHSDTAARAGIDNTPPADVMSCLPHTAAGMEIVRSILNAPITVTSGYRSAEVNRLVGGVSASDHITGNAVDFRCPDFGDPFTVATELAKHKSELNYDQLIFEYGSWVHISFGPKRRLQDLTILNSKQGYMSGIHPKG